MLSSSRKSTTSIKLQDSGNRVTAINGYYLVGCENVCEIFVFHDGSTRATANIITNKNKNKSKNEIESKTNDDDNHNLHKESSSEAYMFGEIMDHESIGKILSYCIIIYLIMKLILEITVMIH